LNDGKIQLFGSGAMACPETIVRGDRREVIELRHL
jgi:hypothetical protein